MYTSLKDYLLELMHLLTPWVVRYVMVVFFVSLEITFDVETV